MNRRFNVHGSGQKKPIPLSKWNDKVDILVKVYNERNKKKAQKKVENELGHSHSPALCQKSRKMLEKVRQSKYRKRRGVERFKIGCYLH